MAPTVVFNMDLANAPTSERFCYEAAAVLDQNVSEDDAAILSDRFGEFVGEVVDEWTSRLEDAGYCVLWNAGDVVVFDLRPLTDDERDAFYESISY